MFDDIVSELLVSALDVIGPRRSMISVRYLLHLEDLDWHLCLLPMEKSV